MGLRDEMQAGRLKQTPRLLRLGLEPIVDLDLDTAYPLQYLTTAAQDEMLNSVHIHFDVVWIRHAQFRDELISRNTDGAKLEYFVQSFAVKSVLDAERGQCTTPLRSRHVQRAVRDVLAQRQRHEGDLTGQAVQIH